MRAINSVLAVLLFLSALGGCSGNPAPPPPSARGERPGDASTGYVGSERCGACHARNYHFWLSTRHAAALTDPSPRNMDAALRQGEDVGLSGKDGSWSVRFRSQDGTAASLPVDFVMSGARRRLYVATGPGGGLVVPPLQMNVRDAGLGRPDGADGATDDWLRDCAGCHVTGLVQGKGKGAGPGGGKWAESGVGCEACHGPGARHANAKDPGKPGTIYNPGNDPDAAVALMVCGRCHTRGVSEQGKAYPEGFEPGRDFRAGFRQAATTDARFFWPDGSSRASRLQYPDFIRSDMRARGVKCWSCHDPHRSSDNNDSGLRMTGSSLCRSCHAPGPGPEGPTHALHGNAACRTCHMPLTAGPAPGGEMASHAFRPIRPSATLSLGGGDVARQPNSCNLCHYHGKQSPEQLEAYLQAGAQKHYGKPPAPQRQGRP